MKKIKIITILLFCLGGLFLMNCKTQAAFQSTIYVSTRDGNFGALKNVSFIIYKQKTDINGRPIPGDQVASGNTKDWGMATVKINIDNRQPMYLAKFYTKNPTVGAIYYYNIDLTSTYTYNLIARLSSLQIILKDAEGKILPNKKFNLYIQKGSPLSPTKGEVYGLGLITNNEGYYDAFLPEGTYLIEIPLDGNTTLVKGNLKVIKEQKTTIIYPISEIFLIAKDERGMPLANQKFAVYEQTTDADGKPALGKKILESATDLEGVKKLFLPPATYALKIPRIKNQDDVSFNQNLGESGLVVVNYSISSLKLILKDVEGNCIQSKSVSVFLQDCASCGPFAESLITHSQTDKGGEVSFKLPAGNYIVKITGTKGFDYYFYDQKINAGENKVTTEYLSLIRVISRNAKGEVLKNFNLTIASQKLDANKKPIPDKTITALNTKDTGFADLYLPAGNYIAIFQKNPVANLKVERSQMTVLTIAEAGKGFDYQVKLIPLKSKTASAAAQPPKPTASKPKINLNNFYGQKRLSLDLEKTLAQKLKNNLEQILGKGRIGVSSENWPTLVNAHIYGGYSPEEIAHTLKNGPLAVHPEIPAPVWRGSADYQKYLARQK